MAINVEKNEDEELPIPGAWRSTICKIVDGFKDGDFQFSNKIPNVYPIAKKEAERKDKTMKYYGGNFTSLPSEAWEKSTYIWMLDHWEAMVDLYTIEDGRSDLVLFVNVFEKDHDYQFVIDSVHVP